MKSTKTLPKLLTSFIAVSVCVVGILFSITPSKVAAVDCTSVPTTGDYTLPESCAFPGTGVIGLDDGTVNSTNTAKLTIGSGKTLTVLNGQTIAIGSIDLSGGGSITLIEGANIKIGIPFYFPDTDNDGLIGSTETRSITGGPGWARRSAIDCNDNNSNVKYSLTCYKDADGDNWNSGSVNCMSHATCVTSTYGAVGTGTPTQLTAGRFLATTGDGTDANDSVPCANGDDPSGACNKCATGNIAIQSSSEDLFSECPALDCDGGATKYYDGWTGDTCYYKLDVSAANAVCDGSGACKTAATLCPGSSKGVSTGSTRASCHTKTGCTGTTAPNVSGLVPADSDTYDDCAAGGTSCSPDSPNTLVGPDGNCNGSGTCNTSGYSYDCPTRGQCQTGGGCSDGSCIPVTTQSSDQDLYDECNTGLCTTGNCSGTSTQCNKLAAGTLCRASAGACDPAEYCDGVLRTCANIYSTSVCRAAAGLCDVAESCTGSDADCPADAYLPAGQQSCGVCTSCTGSNINCANRTGYGYLCATYCLTGVCCTAAQSCPACRTSPSSVPSGFCTTTNCATNCATYCSGSTCCPAAQSCPVCRAGGVSVPNGTCGTTWCASNCNPTTRYCDGTVCRLL